MTCVSSRVFTGNNALKTELQFSDMYCLMAVHVYIDLWRETGESSPPPPVLDVSLFLQRL